MERKLTSGKREKWGKFLVTICPFWFLRFSLYGPILSTLHLKVFAEIWDFRCLILKKKSWQDRVSSWQGQIKSSLSEACLYDAITRLLSFPAELPFLLLTLYQTIVKILINTFSFLFLIHFLQFTYLQSLIASGQKMTIASVG